MLRADISQFYPSIYTHAVPWALHTKPLCKASLKNNKLKKATSLGDSIDSALRSSNEGQTHGIPIGPDACLVVAEILLTAVDAQLAKRLGGALRGFRYVDDYELSFDSLSAAEEALAVLQHELAEVGLQVNPRKTRIEELPQPITSGWARRLGALPVSDKDNPVQQRNHVLALFSEAFTLAPQNESKSVLRYAVARTRHLDIHKNAWRTYCNCVLGTASADASTLSLALGALFEVSKRGGHEIPTTPLAEVFESIIHRHAPRAQSSEVAWALWGALAWSIPLSDSAASLVSQMSDDVVALLALHLESRNQFSKGALNKASWVTSVTVMAVLFSLLA